MTESQIRDLFTGIAGGEPETSPVDPELARRRGRARLRRRWAAAAGTPLLAAATAVAVVVTVGLAPAPPPARARRPPGTGPPRRVTSTRWSRTCRSGGCLPGSPW